MTHIGARNYQIADSDQMCAYDALLGPLGFSRGDSTSTEAASVTGAMAMDISGAAGPVPMVPVSPLVGSDCCSLTFNSPGWIDHLVTFIACEIVTGRGLT